MSPGALAWLANLSAASCSLPLELHLLLDHNADNSGGSHLSGRVSLGPSFISLSSVQKTSRIIITKKEMFSVPHWLISINQFPLQSALWEINRLSACRT